MPSSPGQRGALAFKRVEIEFAVGRMGDHGIGHALVADIGGQRAGIDAVEADDAARLQPLVEMAGGAVVRGIGDRRMDDDARTRRPPRRD